MKDILLAAKELLLAQWKEKEYRCHIRYVAQIAGELAEMYGVDKELMMLAWLLHDIGRDQELPGEDHEITWWRIAREFLAPFQTLNEAQKEIVIGCVIHHNDHTQELTLEQKILMSADSASKILYHEMFMLMCKKETRSEKALRGKKYLEKWLRGIQFVSYKTITILPKYIALSAMYDEVMQDL